MPEIHIHHEGPLHAEMAKPSQKTLKFEKSPFVLHDKTYYRQQQALREYYRQDSERELLADFTEQEIRARNERSIAGFNTAEETVQQARWTRCVIQSEDKRATMGVQRVKITIPESSCEHTQQSPEIRISIP